MKETHLLAGWSRIGSFALLFLALVVGLACSTQPETARTPAPHEAPPASPQPVSTVADASGSMRRKELWTDQSQGSSRMDGTNAFFFHAQSPVCSAEGRGRR